MHSLEKQSLRAWNQLLKVSCRFSQLQSQRQAESGQTDPARSIRTAGKACLNGDGIQTDALQQPSVILKHAFLASLRDQNQVLFYRLMQDHLKELLGILYTPGEASRPESVETC